MAPRRCDPYRRTLLASAALFGALSLPFALGGCASAPKTPASSPTDAPSSPSSVDIAYVLGHNQHRIHAESGTDGARAQAFIDKQMIEQSAIDRGHYAGFLVKASSFIEQSPKPSAPPAPCRTPFTVTVRIGEDTKTSHGCRASDEAAISHLVREGEVLLSTKQN